MTWFSFLFYGLFEDGGGRESGGGGRYTVSSLGNLYIITVILRYVLNSMW